MRSGSKSLTSGRSGSKYPIRGRPGLKSEPTHYDQDDYYDPNQGYNYDGPPPGYYDRKPRNPYHYGPSNHQGDYYRGGKKPNRGGKCPCNDVHIINSLIDSHKDNLLSFNVYLQGMDAAMEVKGAQDGNKSKGLQIDTLLDTGALGVNGNYISPEMADKIDKFRKHRVASDDMRTCSGLSGVCMNTSDSLMLTVKLKQQVFITLRFYILDGPLDLIIGKKAIVKYHVLDMFSIHFGLETFHKVPLCTECSKYGKHSQCTNCSTPHESIHEQPHNNLVPMDIDNDVWLDNKELVSATYKPIHTIVLIKPRYPITATRR